MNQYLILPTNKDLMHHGVLGMSWGKRNGPPYPLNSAGRKALRKQRKAEKKEEAARKLQERKERVQAKHKAQRDKVLMGGTASQVMQYRGEWTNAELKQIVDRLDYEEKITARIPKKKTTQDKMNDLAKSVSDISNFGNKGADLWNTIARYYNASGSGKKNPMPYIPEKGKDYSNKDKDDSSKKKKNKNKSSNTPTKKTKLTPDDKAYWEWDYD